MENKELLLTAINNYDLYLKSYKDVLSIMVSVAIDNVAIIDVKSICEITSLSKPVIYKCIARLEKDYFIKKLNPPGEKASAFKLNMDKLQNVLDVYQKKQYLLNK